MAVKINGEVKYEGQVVAVGSTYMGDGDSYFWAMVFDGDEVKRVSYGSTYGPYDRTASADATEDIIAKVAAMVRPKMADRYYGYAMAKFPEMGKGDMAEVVAGRKIPKGTIGEIRWVGPDNFNRWGTRVGIMVDGAVVFTAGHNVQRIVDEQIYIEMAQTAWADVAAMSDADVVRMYYGYGH